MDRRPRIGITSYPREEGAFSLPEGYVDAVRLGGGIPLVLPPAWDRPSEVLEALDGLVLAGGGDLEPARYGGDDHPEVYKVHPERDAFELELLRSALERKVPVLCICRGMQVLNVLRGGTLHVDIPDRVGREVVHRLPPRRPTRHPVRLAPESRIARIVGREELDVVSWHHQAIDKVGRGLRPVAWSEDGLVEAFEVEDHPWALAVQWHPEMQLDDESQRKLFLEFCSAARRR
ncbi:MAG: hypothetical protein KatS3mg076_2647 [Candidatus Binatia bacterium]|nr:MAG: hypothetical protein KatS3mg076_2647 [Candidatus Binatia bacterium]